MNNGDNNEDNKSQHNDEARERLQTASRRGLNAVTGGRWDKVRNAPIVGAAAKKAENKVADKLGNSKLGKKIVNHQRPNLGAPTKDNQEGNTANNTENAPTNAKSGDVGSQNLRTSLANKAKNLWNQRKKKKKGKDESSNEEEKKEDNNSESKDEEKKDDDKDEKDSTLSPEEKASIKRKIQIKLAIIGLGAFLIYFLVMTIASALTGGGVFKVAPVSSVRDYGTDSFQTVTPEDSPVHKEELAFYKKIKEAVKEYGEDVNINYVAALLMEVFYEYDPSYEYESEEEAQRLMEAGGLDYAKMAKNVDTFAKLIKDLESTDYEIGGKIYNALKTSSEFQNYYKEALKKKNIDDVLKNVFELAKELDVDGEYDDTTITDDTNVNNTVNNQTQNMSMNQYLTDSIYASTDKLTSKEVVKAYTIVYSTNVVATNKKLTINNNTAIAANQLCSVKEGCSYNSSGTLVTGPGLQTNDNPYYYNGGYYSKVPLSEPEQKELNNSINSTYGNVLVKSDGTYPTLDASVLDGFGDGDGDYKAIIKKAYGEDFKYKNVGENSYILDGSYGTKKVKTEVIFYDQKDYPRTFCGLKGYTIAGSGCGVTAMAILASTYENSKKYDPVYMNSEAQKKGLCGSTGTAQAFFGKEATALHYKYSGGTKYNKTILNLALKHLSQGHLVVVRMGSGHFTGGGHYMVLGGVDPDTKKVYVYDPNNRSNSSYRKTGNGWYSFNDIIVKEAYNFYVIWKG